MGPTSSPGSPGTPRMQAVISPGTFCRGLRSPRSPGLSKKPVHRGHAQGGRHATSSRRPTCQAPRGPQVTCDPEGLGGIAGFGGFESVMITREKGLISSGLVFRPGSSVSDPKPLLLTPGCT